MFIDSLNFFPVLGAGKIVWVYYTSWRGLTALLILVGRRCESLSGGMSEVSFPPPFCIVAFRIIYKVRPGRGNLGRRNLFYDTDWATDSDKIERKGEDGRLAFPADSMQPAEPL